MKNKFLHYQFVLKKIHKKSKYFAVKKIAGKSLKNCIKQLEDRLQILAAKKHQIFIKDFNKFEKRFKFKNSKKNYSLSVELIKYEVIF